MKRIFLIIRITFLCFFIGGIIVYMKRNGTDFNNPIFFEFMYAIFIYYIKVTPIIIIVDYISKERFKTN